MHRPTRDTQYATSHIARYRLFILFCFI
jgi:hypothetical protein